MPLCRTYALGRLNADESITDGDECKLEAVEVRARQVDPSRHEHDPSTEGHAHNCGPHVTIGVGRGWARGVAGAGGGEGGGGGATAARARGGDACGWRDLGEFISRRRGGAERGFVDCGAVGGGEPRAALPRRQLTR